MPAKNRVPSIQIASGTANERDNSYNIPTGSIFFNTDTSNIELSGNVVASDISGVDKITFVNGATMGTAPAGGAKAAWFAHPPANTQISVDDQDEFAFDQAPINIGSGYSTTTGKFTCPAGCAGKYFVVFNIMTRGNQFNAGTIVNIDLRKTSGGTETIEGGLRSANLTNINDTLQTFNQWYILSGSIIVDLAVGDSIYAVNDSGGGGGSQTDTVKIVGTAQEFTKSNFQGFWISE